MSQSSDVLREDLAVIDPWGAIPGWSIEDGPKIEEEHRTYASWWEGTICCWVLDGLCDGDVATDIPQAERTTKSSNHEQIAASEIVDQEKEPDQGHWRLDDSKDTGTQKSWIGAHHANTRKDSWAVVIYRIDT